MDVAVKRDKAPAKAEKTPPPATRSALPGLREEVDRLHSHIEHVFDDAFSGWRFPRLGNWRFPSLDRLFDVAPFERLGAGLTAVMPKVDVTETKDDYRIKAELAGLGEKDIEVVLSDGTLTLKGEKSEAKEEKDKDYHLSERRFGSFMRSFAVPEGVEANKIEAGIDKGVLTIVMPKSAESKKKARKIEVKKKA